MLYLWPESRGLRCACENTLKFRGKFTCSHVKIKNKVGKNETIFEKNGLKEVENTGKVPEKMQIIAAKGCEGLKYQHPP